MSIAGGQFGRNWGIALDDADSVNGAASRPAAAFPAPYDGGRVAANQSLLEAMNAASLRQLAKRTGLHKETIIAIRRGQKVKLSTLAKVVMGLREE